MGKVGKEIVAYEHTSPQSNIKARKIECIPKVFFLVDLTPELDLMSWINVRGMMLVYDNSLSSWQTPVHVKNKLSEYVIYGQ